MRHPARKHVRSVEGNTKCYIVWSHTQSLQTLTTCLYHPQGKHLRKPSNWSMITDNCHDSALASLKPLQTRVSKLNLSLVSSYQDTQSLTLVSSPGTSFSMLVLKELLGNGGTKFNQKIKLHWRREGWKREIGENDEKQDVQKFWFIHTCKIHWECKGKLQFTGSHWLQFIKSSCDERIFISCNFHYISCSHQRAVCRLLLLFCTGAEITITDPLSTSAH